MISQTVEQFNDIKISEFSLKKLTAFPLTSSAAVEKSGFNFLQNPHPIGKKDGIQYNCLLNEI